MRNEKPFNVIKAKCPEVYKWLRNISRYSEVEKYILPDYKHGIHIYLYTHNYRYSIRMRPPKEKNDEDDGYLGCTVMTRKPIAGEDWNRGNDLADGKYSEKTWREIVNDIIAYELVKVAKPREHITDGSKCWCNPKIIKVKPKENK